MPVIRGESRVKPLTSQQRKSPLRELAKEVSGTSSEGGPIIFEIPLEQSDRMDVLVVWDAMADLRSEDRTDLIMEVYQGRADKIAQAVGASRKEAIAHGWLPVQVAWASTGPVKGVTSKELRKAMLEEGGFDLENNVVLRLPSFAMAEQAAHRLMSRIPQVQWYVEEVSM